jgi:hypothetical protein
MPKGHILRCEKPHIANRTILTRQNTDNKRDCPFAPALSIKISKKNRVFAMFGLQIKKKMLSLQKIFARYGQGTIFSQRLCIYHHT